MVSQGFFSGSANQKKRMAGDSPTGDIKLAGSNQVAQPLSEVGSPAYEKEVQGYIKIQKSDPYYDLKFDPEGYRINKFRDRIEETPSFSEDIMRQNYEGVRKFLYERNPLQYQEGVPLSKKKEDEGNILQKTGTFLANIVSPAAVAGTLEGKPTRFAGQASPTVSKDSDTRSSVTTSSSGMNRSQSRRSGRSTSSSRGGVSRGSSRSNTGSKSASRGASGSAGSRSRGGTGPGRTSTSRTASKASRSRTGRSRSQCDIRTKIDINPLTNNNLIRDDLANVAYFVREIK